MSDAFYKNLELQMKEMGQAYWACRSCLSFCNKMNTQIKEVDKRVDKLMGKLEENTAGLKKADEKIEEVRKAVGKVERKQEDSEKRIEENMAEEMRAREAIRRNIIVHGIPEPDSRIKTDKERSEADLVECDHIFKATGARIGRKDIRFCRRIGERGQEKRPLLVGMKTEIIKTTVGRGKRAAPHRLQDREHLPRPDTYAETSREETVRKSGTEKQGGSHRRRQVKKLEMDGGGKKRRKKDYEGTSPGGERLQCGRQGKEPAGKEIQQREKVVKQREEENERRRKDQRGEIRRGEIQR